jgi:hypothetical protein
MSRLKSTDSAAANRANPSNQATLIIQLNKLFLICARSLAQLLAEEYAPRQFFLSVKTAFKPPKVTK